MNVTALPTEHTRDAIALERMVDGLVERHKARDIRCGWVFVIDSHGDVWLSAANTTLNDEAFAVAVMQERLMRLLGP